MQELTLESEFTFWRNQHRYNILFKRIERYYEDLLTSGVALPQFMREQTSEDLATNEMNKIINNEEHFAFLYEKAYQELADMDEI